MTHNPTWYDILGVAPDATAEQIKTAWRDATDKFEPGSGTGQFRLFNEAADVLLDPAKRAAYDAELATSDVALRDGRSATSSGTAEVETAVLEPEAPTPDVDPVETAVTGFETAAAQPPQPPAAEASLVDRLGGSLTAVLLLALPLLLVGALLILGSTSGWKIGGLKMDSVSERSDARDWDAGQAASSAASRAMTAVLAYDYRHLEADRDRAEKFFTAGGRKDYLKNFNLLIQGKDGQVGPAVKTKTVVTADVLQTAVSDASKNRARVVVFVNQTAVKGEKGTPAVFQNRLVVTMDRDGSDWLVDKIRTF